MGLMMMMDMVIVMVMAMVLVMVMVMVLVIVIIVPEVLRQVGWLHQRQHQSFHRLNAFY
jgi:1,4-dihydroxy-2-naphthoate octaprenyltransferase